MNHDFRWSNSTKKTSDLKFLQSNSTFEISNWSKRYTTTEAMEKKESAMVPERGGANRYTSREREQWWSNVENSK